MNTYDQVVCNIVDYVYTSKEFSEQAYDIAIDCLFDSIGCAIKALNFEACTRLIYPLVDSELAGKGAKVLNTNTLLDPVSAAFNIGSMIRWLEFNDSWIGEEWGHPSDNLGAILAISDWLQRANIKTEHELTLGFILDCLIKAYEIQGILCLKNPFNKLGMDHVIFLKIASTAISAYLFSLTKEQARQAVMNAFIDGHPLRVYRQSPNACIRKSWAAGDATSRGVRLAMICQVEDIDCPTALTDEKWGFNKVFLNGAELKIEQEYDEYVINHVFFKLFPAECHAISAVECAIVAHKQINEKGKKIRDILKVEIETQRPALKIIDKSGDLNSTADRDHCIQYMVAVALLTGDLQSEDYLDLACDQEVENLRSKTFCVENSDFTTDYYNAEKMSIANRLKISFKDGSHLDPLKVEYPIGHWRRRDESKAYIVKKFQENIKGRISESKVNTLLNYWHNKNLFYSLNISDFIDTFDRGEI